MFESPVSEWHRLVSRVDATKLLPYRFFEEENDMYYNADGSTGFILECNVLPGCSDMVFAGLSSAMSFIPAGCTIQFILMSSPDVVTFAQRWFDSKNTTGLFTETKENYRQFLFSHNWDKISRNFYAPFRNFNLFITVKDGGKKKEFLAFKDFFVNQGPKEKKDLLMRSTRLAKVRDGFAGALKSAFLRPRNVGPNKLMDALYPFLNPAHDYRTKPSPDKRNLSNFMIDNDTVFEIHDQYLKVDGMYSKSLSIKDYPESSSFHNTIGYVGNPLGNDNFSTPFIVCLNVIKLPDKEKSHIQRNAALVMNQSLPYAMFPKLKHKHEDLTFGLEKLDEGLDLYKMCFELFVFAKDEESLDENISSFKTYYQSMGFRLENDKYIHFPVLLSVLPFGYDEKTSQFLSRDRAVFEDNIVDLAPVTADWQGNSEKVLFTSPRGQLVGFDLFSNDAGGYNAFVVGMTGSGKSVFLQWLSLNYLMEGANVWVIDIGRSYEKLANVFDGEFIEMKQDMSICVNPFSEIKDDSMLAEYKEFLIGLFLLMGTPKEKQLAEQLEKLLKSYLEEAISASYSKDGKDSCVDSVIEELKLMNEKINDPRLSDYIRTMRPFTSDGQYSSIFNGKSTLAFNKKLTVLENDTLENMPDIRDPLLMVLTFHISKEIYMSVGGERHIVIIDEAHKFLGSPHTDLFIEQAYRRFRKHGASMILGTQGFEDFYGGAEISRAGRVIVQNSYWKFFMMQTSTSRNAIYNSGYFSFTKMEEMLMDSLNPLAGEYSELMIVSDIATAKVRIVLDDFLKTLFFTTAELRLKIQKLVESGKSWTEAIREVQGTDVR